MNFLDFLTEEISEKSEDNLNNWMSKRSVEFMEDFIKKHPGMPLWKHKRITDMIIAKRKAIRDKAMADPTKHNWLK